MTDAISREQGGERGDAVPGGTGGEAIVRALLGAGVDVCFANPGTSEMHFVAALDLHPGMRAVLCLFEGVASGAADGFARMAGRPAATLLHLGPGLGNAWANLHNARRSGAPVVNIVGEHASGHLGLDSPLESDIVGLAASVSGWVRVVGSPESAGADVADAVTAATALHGGIDAPPPGSTGTGGAVSTLVVPADIAWTAVTGARLVPDREPVPDSTDPLPADGGVGLVVRRLRAGKKVALLLGPTAAADDDLRAADRIRQVTGTRVHAEVFSAHRRRGAGLPRVTDVAYRAEEATRQFEDVEVVVLLGAAEPTSSFAYPGRSSRILPAEAEVLRVPAGAAGAFLHELAGEVAPGVTPTATARSAPHPVSGALTTSNWGRVFAAELPAEAIISDESITSGMNGLTEALDGAEPHDSLGLKGLAIGQGIPVAIGAAIARPDRPVFNLQADGSAMYTISGLWTQAREALNITTVILDNAAYAILRDELTRVGAAEGAASESLITLGRPALDFVSLARGFGVPGRRAETAEEFRAALGEAAGTRGPFLIHAVLR